MKRGHRVLGILAIAAVYFITGSVGLSLQRSDQAPFLLWVPTAFGFAMVLLYGLRWLPGCALGSFLIVVNRGIPVTSSIFIGAVEALELAMGWFLLRRVLHFRVGLERARDVVGFICVSFLMTLFGTSTDIAFLVATGTIDASRFFELWSTWWWGRWSGTLVVAPAIMTCMCRSQHTVLSGPRRLLEFVMLSLLGALTVILIVAPWAHERIPSAHTGYYVLPVLLWAGLRFGPRGAALASLGACITGIVAESMGLGHFQRMLELQTFVALSTMSTLLLSAVAVERLRAVERQAAVVTAAIDGIVSIDERGRIIEINPAAERMLDVRAHDVVGEDVANVAIPERLRAVFHRSLQRFRSNDTSFLAGARYRSTAWRATDETEFPVEVSVSRLPLEDTVIFTGFVRDISAEQRAERTVREAHELLERKVQERTCELKRANENLERRDTLMREAEQLAHLGSFDYDITSGTLTWSDELYRLYGRDPATFTPTLEGFFATVHPDDRDVARQLVSKAMVTGDPMNRVERIVRPDGTIRTIQTFARTYPINDGTQHIVGCCQDITDRAQAEETRARLVGLVEYSDDAIIGLSPDGDIETWNAAASRLFGYDAAHAVGRNCDILVREEDCSRLHEVYSLIRQRHHVAHYELPHKRSDGTVFDASVTTSAVVGANGEVVGMCKVIRDISEQKRAEHQMLASLREKEVLLREIHHRVKNNLQVIASLLNLQLTTEGVGSPAYKALVESQSRIHSMALVHQLLYRSKDLAQIDVSEYLSRLVTKVNETYAVSNVEVDVHAECVLLDIDRAIPCGLIVAELLTNALTHGFPTGAAGHVRVELAIDNGQLVLSVTDDGVGIPPELTTESPQTFGLQIVRTLAAQLEGSVTITRDGGTAVTLRFPEAAPVNT